MKRIEQGTLYPFRLSGSRMRQSAVQLRRQGQVLDAMTLMRRAAEQEDTPAAWQVLACELRQLGLWETAAQVMGRVLSMQGRLPGAWLEMARCMQALEQRPMALDCVYHLLQEDPWSPEADAGREMLASLETENDEKCHRRLPLLVSRGMRAWTAGERKTGERQIRRALKMSREPERLLCSAAMMCMLGMDLAGAEKYLLRALRHAPEDSRTLTALSTLYSQQGKHEEARQMLKLAADSCDSVLAEDSFLTAAWAQDAWDELTAFLDARMKQYPYRAALLCAKATMLYEQGDTRGAQQLWKDVLALDPDQRQAAAMLSAVQAGAHRIVLPGMLPVPERRAQKDELAAMAQDGRPLAELLRQGSRSRQLIDWCLCGNDPDEQSLALELLTREDDTEAVPYLRELVARPFLQAETRQWALLRLAELGSLDEMIMPAGNHYTLIQCQRISQRRQESPWLSFFPSLLTETRRYRRSPEILEYAAEIWGCLAQQQREEAAGSGRFVWCKAVEVLFLRMQGEDSLAARVAHSTPLSHRRITRVLRRIAKRLDLCIDT